MIRLYLFLAISVLLCSSEVQSAASDVGSAVAMLQKKTAALLPGGWKASQTNNTIVVQRMTPVRLVNLINAPGRSEGETEDEYLLAHSFQDYCWIKLRLGDHLSAGKLAEMRRENEAVLERLAALESKMRHITHKFGDYLPSNPQEEQLVADYSATQAAYRVLPEYHFESFAVYLTEKPPAMISFYSQKDSREFDRVRTAILANLQAYEHSTPNQRQRTRRPRD